MIETDTIVIGGGLSGLFAALRLQDLKIPYLLLEAKPEFGGRITGYPVAPGSDVCIDLGPTWFWPHQTLMKQLLARLQVEWFEQYSTGDTLVQRRPDEASFRIQNDAGTMTSCRVTGGVKQLVSALAGQLEQTKIKTEHPVTVVRKSGKKWQVTTVCRGLEQNFSANRMILAVPPRLIVKYLTPEAYMSEGLVKALQAEQTWMAGQAKFIAVYKEPFWRKKGLAGQAFSHVGPLVEIHDASCSAGSGFALFGFIGVSSASRAQLSRQQLTAQCLEQLGTIFGLDALNAAATHVEDWAQDIWVATELDALEPPRHCSFDMEQHEKELEELKVHLVASEFAQFEAGYLEGALMAVETAIQTLPPWP
ncbi:FAD-dependent oxidoreductase [Desulforhopalus sp. IMCC35007]|uniref:flavin monoamine oxidase family protein n=1 Tax=Desulforhopalus sp. IMCC35007 TaxID=2569543 RepID=UPI0010AEAEDE|nr:FAD-dependent oxidoreductase [Desulforhopalus sp. IMCC35007]TKB06865.1 monoamine oxidase [Desulforhopalus sp. IMCC35007]